MRLLPFLLLANSLSAQTVQNPSFEQTPIAPMVTNANGSYNNGQAIVGWTCTGNYGLWQPATAEFSAVPDGTTVAYSNGGTCSQDLGQVAAGTYTLTFQQGNRGDGIGGNASCTVALGTASVTTPNSGIGLGKWQQVSVIYTSTAASDLMVSFSGSGAQCDFDKVTLALTNPQPFVFQLQGGPSVSFPMAVPPACGPSDGACAISFQWCDTSLPPKCTPFPFAGELDAVKTGAQGTQVIFIVKASSP